MIVQCPECDSDLREDGVCSSLDCGFVACPICLAAEGAPLSGCPAGDGASVDCGHLILFEQGEVDPRFDLDMVHGVPVVVSDPPDDEWFDAALAFEDTDGPLGVPASLVEELDPDLWSDRVIDALVAPIARRRGALLRTSQLGATTWWLPDPMDFWSEVAASVDVLLHTVRRGPVG